MSTIDPFAGMAVNERLAHFGLLGAFDSAVAARDMPAIAPVLQRARLTEQRARQTATAVLADPGFHGLR